MPIDPDSLPSDVATLRAMLSAQAVEMAEQATMVAAQRTELDAARAGLLEQRASSLHGRREAVLADIDRGRRDQAVGHASAANDHLCAQLQRRAVGFLERD
jgi:hypothetical protein